MPKTTCGSCCGNGTEEYCAGCDEPVENCECDYPEGEPPGSYDEECSECDGEGHVEGEDEDE